MFSTPNTHGGRTLQRLIWLRAQRFLEAGLPPRVGSVFLVVEERRDRTSDLVGLRRIQLEVHDGGG
jgi:hypothetical protein